MNQLKPSELILNSDGSIYHLNLLPEDLADTIILVGDPHRVARVSRHFDRIEVKKSKRELVTHTGMLGGQRISVIGTGMGTGNIDIVINECDALANIDFSTRQINEKIRRLKFIRMGTSGGLHESIPVGTLLLSAYAIGLDGLLSYYQHEKTPSEISLQQICERQFGLSKSISQCYVAQGSAVLINQFAALGKKGITLTCPGFYGPQYRQLRIPLVDSDLSEVIADIRFEDCVVANAEMETSAIYGLSRIFGHQACSISAIVANRMQGAFVQDVDAVVDDMIERVLGCLVRCESLKGV